MKSSIITAQVPVEADVERVRRWFLELESHPERYRFETHAGFTFTQGDFGEVGARFQTQERFHGLPITLNFELTEVTDTYFRFCLIRPPLPVWGAFAIQQANDATAHLRLEIGGTTRLGAWLLRLPLVNGAIHRQIRAEVQHIQASIEAL